MALLSRYSSKQKTQTRRNQKYSKVKKKRAINIQTYRSMDSGNRFQCPFERNVSGKDTPFDVDDLFRLHKMAFAVEISLAKAKKDGSEIRIKNKEELLYALTDKDTFDKILEQGAEAPEASEYIKDYLRDNRAYLLDYFMRIKDLVTAEELSFY